jgi:hypothetical protein
MKTVEFMLFMAIILQCGTAYCGRTICYRLPVVRQCSNETHHLRNYGVIRNRVEVWVHLPSGHKYCIPAINGILPQIVEQRYSNGSVHLWCDYSRGVKHYGASQVKYHREGESLVKPSAPKPSATSAPKPPAPKPPALKTLLTPKKIPLVNDLDDLKKKVKILTDENKLLKERVGELENLPKKKVAAPKNELIRPSQVTGEEDGRTKTFPRYESTNAPR